MPPSARQAPRHVSSVAVAQQPPPRILAIDYGRRKIGVAISDSLGLTAQPLAILERKNRRDDLRRLREICAEHHVSRILVGHPVRLSGEAGEMAHEAARFAARLQKHLGIEVELVDERLTSWEAQQGLAEVNPPSRPSRRPSSHRTARRPLDHIAAAIFLREYLERAQGRSASRPAGGE